MPSSTLVELQTRRLRFEELGAALEAYAQRLTPQQGRTGVLVEASNTYRAGALYDAEFTVLKGIGLQSTPEMRQRYFELLLQRMPQELVQLTLRPSKLALIEWPSLAVIFIGKVEPTNWKSENWWAERSSNSMLRCPATCAW
jgi:hypothetical protein